MSIYVGDKEIKNLFIGESTKDYSAMRGPCPTGFHVPKKDEFVSLLGILTTTFSLAGNSTTMGTYLKMPMAGGRSSSTSKVLFQNQYGYYWHSSYSEGGIAYELKFTSSTLDPQDSNTYIGNAQSIRPFKDSPELPDSSWTTLYNGSSIATGAGIFWNSTLGLISVSGDGSTWYTISDKNLGATTVYNSGNTLSEANCGKYYQWGNNYGFPRTGTLSGTSSTQVNASNYGPGSYYNSGTFIKKPNWDVSNNKNLRGGETGITEKPKEAKAVYLGNTKVRESGPSLLTYEELIALTQTEALTELNSNVEAYYNKLNSEEHIVYYEGDDDNYLLGYSNTIGDGFAFNYNTGTYAPLEQGPQKGVVYKLIKIDPTNMSNGFFSTGMRD